MTDKRIIIFAGPPGVGKDLAANVTVNYIKQVNRHLNPQKMSLADPIKDAVHKMYGLPYDGTYFDDPRNAILKDKPHPLLFGKTPRRAYIDMSTMMQEKYGPHFFGDVCANTIHNSKNLTFVFSSGGTSVEEWMPIIDYVHGEALYVQIHSTGKVFRDGTRSYLGDALRRRHNGLQLIDLENVISQDPFDKELFLMLVKGAVKKFLGLEE